MNNQQKAGTIKSLREQRAWSQEQLAGVAGISPRTVQRIEAGVRPSYDTIIALANAFGLDVVDLKRMMEVDATSSRDSAVEAEEIPVSLIPRIKHGVDLMQILDWRSPECWSDEDLSETEDQMLTEFFTVLGCCRGHSHGFFLIRLLDPKLKLYGKRIDEKLNILEANGFLVFAERSKELFLSGTNRYPVKRETVIVVARAQNPRIIRRAHDLERLPVTKIAMPFKVEHPDLSLKTLLRECWAQTSFGDTLESIFFKSRGRRAIEGKSHVDL